VANRGYFKQVDEEQQSRMAHQTFSSPSFKELGFEGSMKELKRPSDFSLAFIVQELMKAHHLLDG
jgi:hypothetical protein